MISITGSYIDLFSVYITIKFLSYIFIAIFPADPQIALVLFDGWMTANMLKLGIKIYKLRQNASKIFMKHTAKVLTSSRFNKDAQP